mmetsp:Transcript_8911/g.13796  ORF Transcript_8911/g.13796 Transcript_8911/m.13796 type:complete len:114 (+) Transcript_8911:310-651(+)
MNSEARFVPPQDFIQELIYQASTTLVGKFVALRNIKRGEDIFSAIVLNEKKNEDVSWRLDGWQDTEITCWRGMSMESGMMASEPQQRNKLPHIQRVAGQHVASSFSRRRATQQ